MVRTADSAIRVSGSKSSKAIGKASGGGGSHGGSSSGGSGGGGSDSRSSSYSGGGNPVHPRETPSWQKPITNFFTTKAPPPSSIDKNDGGEVESMDAIGEAMDCEESAAASSTTTMNGVEIGGRGRGEGSKETDTTQNTRLTNGQTSVITTNNKRKEMEEDEMDEGEKLENAAPSSKKMKMDMYKHLEELETS